MSLEVDRQYRLLNQILRLRCAPPNSREFALVIGTEMTAQSVEQRAVRSRVAIQAGKHQCLEFDFAGRHACISLLVRRSNPFGYRGRSPFPKRYSRKSGFRHSAASERSKPLVAV